MGRPLKISKASLRTITDTTTGTNIVTLSGSTATTGLDVGQTFVAATTIGGITGGTTYFIKSISNGTTITLSDTWNGTVLPLTTASGTVVASVGMTDSGFNNPASASYGVVGGNTGIYGNQVLPRIAISTTGIGTLTVLSGNTEIYGAFTDFANTVSVGSAVVAADGTALGFVATRTGLVSTTCTGTTAVTNYITSGVQTLSLNKPIVFAAALSNIAANTLYFVSSIANTTAFTVSATQGGANVVLGTTTLQSVVASHDEIIMAAAPTSTYVATGWTQSKDEAGFILRQKGRSKFLVQGSTTGLVGACFTANVANAALTAGQMNMVATDAAAANVFIERLDDHQAHGFGNTDAALSYVATFGTAYAANTYGGQPEPIVTIAKL